ncbi:MAG: hypothetical protein ABJM18_19720, partial [Hyphomonas sp.]
RLHVDGAVRIGALTGTALPDTAATGAGGLACVTDALEGVCLVFSDGPQWRRISDWTTLT